MQEGDEIGAGRDRRREVEDGGGGRWRMEIGVEGRRERDGGGREILEGNCFCVKFLRRGLASHFLESFSYCRCTSMFDEITFDI